MSHDHHGPKTPCPVCAAMRVREELARLNVRAEELQAWLTSPQPLLEGRIPARMIAIGEGAKVLALLQAITSGAHP